MAAEGSIPGAIPAADEGTALPYLQSAAPNMIVVVYDEVGIRPELPGSWPARLEYFFVVGGYEGWRTNVLTPIEQEGYDLGHVEFVARQNQIAAYFSGTAVATSEVSAPPPVISGGGTKKKKNRGC